MTKLTISMMTQVSQKLSRQINAVCYCLPLWRFNLTNFFSRFSGGDSSIQKERFAIRESRNDDGQIASHECPNAQDDVRSISSRPRRGHEWYSQENRRISQELARWLHWWIAISTTNWVTFVPTYYINYIIQNKKPLCTISMIIKEESLIFQHKFFISKMWHILGYFQSLYQLH